MKFLVERDTKCIDYSYTLNLDKMQRMLRSFRARLNAIINDAKSSPSAFAAYVTGQTCEKYKDTLRYTKNEGRACCGASEFDRNGLYETIVVKHEVSLVEAYKHLLVKLWPNSKGKGSRSKLVFPSLGILTSHVLGKQIGKLKCSKQRENWYRLIPSHFRRYVLFAHLVEECKQHVRSYHFYRALLEVYWEYELTLQVTELLEYLIDLRPLGLYQEFHYIFTMFENFNCVNRLITKLEQSTSVEQYLHSGFTEYVTNLSSPQQVISLLANAWRSLITKAKTRRSIARDALVQMRTMQWTSALITKFVAISNGDHIIDPISIEPYGNLVGQLVDLLIEVQIPAFSSSCLSLGLMLLNHSFIYDLRTKHWVNQIRKLFVGGGRINLDVVVFSYKTHQNLLALGRTCQRFHLLQLAIDIVENAITRYDEIYQESNLSTCPTIQELAKVMRELERHCFSSEKFASKRLSDLSINSHNKNISNSKSPMYKLTFSAQTRAISKQNKRKIHTNSRVLLNTNFQWSVVGMKRKVASQEHEDEDYSPYGVKKSKIKAASRDRDPLRDITSTDNVSLRPRRLNAGKGVPRFWIVSPKDTLTQDNGWSKCRKRYTNTPTSRSTTNSQLTMRRVKPLPPTQIDELCI